MKNQKVNSSGEFYANTQKQLLSHHLFAVGYVAEKLFELSVDNEDYKKMKESVFIAAYLHDIGKCDPNFQKWVKGKKQAQPEVGEEQEIDNKGFSFEDYPRHNEISLLWFFLFEKEMSSLNNKQKESLQHLIYWHHAKPFRKEDKFKFVVDIYSLLAKKLKETGMETFFKGVANVLHQVCDLAKEYHCLSKSYEKLLNLPPEGWQNRVEEFCDNKKGSNFPSFKEYDQNSLNNIKDSLTSDIKTNAIHNIQRACLISADRLISALTSEELEAYILQKKLDELAAQHIQHKIKDSFLQDCLLSMKKFSDSPRTQRQNQVADKLSEIQNVAVLAGAAGCGKTRIALEWAKRKEAKQIFWICPRVQVCQGIFTELTKNYLPNAHIEIFTGEFKFTNSWGEPTKKEEYFSADIVVTTIDQIFKAIVSHTKVDGLIPFMEAHVIFDEFHEYINMEIFNLLFAELIKNKQMRKEGMVNTLLVSATPNYLYLKNILDIDTEQDVVEMESFNESQYQIEFVAYDENSLADNPFYEIYDNKTFVITNTAKGAQRGFIYQQKNENSILYHSKFKQSDKKRLFECIYESFKQNGTFTYDVLRSGPVVQASLNISCDHMISEISSAENILQRLGRLDRFGQNTEVNVMKIAMSEDIKNGSSEGASAQFLAKLHQLKASKIWAKYLEEKIGRGVFTLPKIYQVYKEFYDDCSHDLRGEMLKGIEESINAINKKVTEPIKVVSTKASPSVLRISKNSLRGDSRFVQAAMIDVNDVEHPKFLNQYAYHVPKETEEYCDYITESLSVIQNAELIDFMAKKQHNIDPESPTKGIPERKQKDRKKVIENYARDANYPIYLSYIEDDLDKVGGVGIRCSKAIYYAVCAKQAVGLLSIDELLKFQPC